jgi:hypothetical protein
MARQAATKTGIYLYAVASPSAALAVEGRAQPGPAHGPAGIGGGAVYSIRCGRLAAVVSDVPNGKLRPERRHLAAHYDVLQLLMKQTTVLPMTFGTVADGPEEIRRILSFHEATLLEQLQRVKGKVEMGLRVLWDVPNIFEYFVGMHSELRALRDQVFRDGRQPSQNEKIELGQAFDRSLQEERAARRETVAAALKSCSREIKDNSPRNEYEVMDLACLIAREAQGQFERAVFEAAKEFDDHYSFDISGPWPPYSFVSVDPRMA